MQQRKESCPASRGLSSGDLSMIPPTVRQVPCLRAAVLSAWLAVSVVGHTLPAFGQSSAAFLPDAPQTGQASAPQALQIVILEGEGALNNIRDRTAREPIVEVQDENHKPVAGALVLFTIHSGTSGAGAAVGGASSLSVTTGVNGQAILQGFQVNQVAGAYTIQVQAKLGNLTAQNTIHESNGSSSSTSETQQQASQTTASTGSRLSILKNGKFLAGAAVTGLALAIVFGVHSHSTGITAGNGSVHP